MPFRHLFYPIVLVCLYLSGCHSNSPAPSTSLFKDEKSMREALKGEWILKEYEDSIDAGLTPKLLEYLLGPKSLITYDRDQMEISGFETRSNGVLNSEGSLSVHSLRFDVPNKRLVMEIRSDSTTTDFDTEGRPTERKLHGRIVEIDTADFIVQDADTILRLNIGDRQIDFVKYDNNKCPEEPVYTHLVNSKFIAGKYYALSETGHTHHIIFTRCGGLEGGENIDASFIKRTQYGVCINNFMTEPDAIEFYNPEYKMGRVLYWEVRQDSLILYENVGQKGNRMVLVKAL